MIRVTIDVDGQAEAVTAMTGETRQAAADQSGGAPSDQLERLAEAEIGAVQPAAASADIQDAGEPAQSLRDAIEQAEAGAELGVGKTTGFEFDFGRAGGDAREGGEAPPAD